jgi:hypothetical protein
MDVSALERDIERFLQKEDGALVLEVAALLADARAHFEHAECPVELRTSTIAGAGRGLIAKRDIARGEPVCFYDCVPLSGPRLAACTERGISYTYLKSVSGDKHVLGLDTARHPAGVAQFANDRVLFPYDPLAREDLSEQKMLAKICIYHQISATSTSVHFRPENPLLYYAIRDIAKGDELFLSYGAPYWVRLAIFRVLGTISDEDFQRAHQYLAVCDRLYCDMCAQLLNVAQAKRAEAAASA